MPRRPPSLVAHPHVVTGPFLTAHHRALIARATTYAERRWLGDGSRRALLTHLDVVLLRRILNHINRRTGSASPSMARLAQLGGTSVGTVSVGARRLEAAGLLVIDRQRVRGQHGSPPRTIHTYGVPPALPAPPPPIRAFRQRLDTTWRIASALAMQRGKTVERDALQKELACSKSGGKQEKVIKNRLLRVEAQLSRIALSLCGRLASHKSVEAQVLWSQVEDRTFGQKHDASPVRRQPAFESAADRAARIARLTKTLGIQPSARR